MKFLRSAALVLLLAATSLPTSVVRAQSAGGSASVTVDIEIDTSVEFENADDDEFGARVETGVAFRATSFIGTGFIPDFCFFSSLEANANNGSGELDTIAGAIFAGNGGPVVSFLAHLMLDGTLGVAPGVTDLIALDLDADTLFTASVPYVLSEVAADGTVVQTISLADLPGVAIAGNNLRWRMNAEETGFGGSDDVKNCVFDLLDDRYGDLEVKFEVVKSAQAGAVVGTSAIITPNSIEQFVTISGFPYMNETNYVQLSFLVASADLSADTGVDGQLTFTDDVANAFFSLAAEAQADGNSVSTTVTVEAFAGVFPDDLIDGYLDAVFNGDASASLQLFNVRFDAAGAAQIVFDPTMGVGEQPRSSAAAPSPGAGAAGALLLPLSLIAGLVASAWLLN